MESLSEGDRAIVKDIAVEAVGAIRDELIRSFNVQLELHAATCPAKKTLNRLWVLILGVAIGSGGGFATVLKLFKVF